MIFWNSLSPSIVFRSGPGCSDARHRTDRHKGITSGQEIPCNLCDPAGQSRSRNLALTPADPFQR